MNPHNWPLGKRIGATLLIAAIGFIVGYASSTDSAATTQAAADFHVSDVTESLATGLFLIGFGFGALFAGPISETIGRNPVYIITMAIYIIWVMASALSPNIGAQLAFRFLAGFFGSTPLTCAGGSISDLWSPMERVYAFPVFANAAFMGPIFGPVVGGTCSLPFIYIYVYIHFRWYLTLACLSWFSKRSEASADPLHRLRRPVLPRLLALDRMDYPNPLRRNPLPRPRLSTGNLRPYPPKMESFPPPQNHRR